MFEKIVVPLDMSKNSEMVLPYIEEIAGKFRSEIKLAGVLEAEPLKDNISSPSPTIDRSDILRLYLSDITKRIINEGKEFGMSDSNKVTYQLLTGNIAKAILSYAGENDADLLALTSRGSSDQEEWALGNISAKVIRATKKPVLLIRAEVNKTALSQKNLVKKILLPLDGSQLGEAAIPYAGALAGRLAAQLVLVHVTEPMIKWGMYDTNPANPPMESLESRNAAAEAYLANVVISLKEKKGLSALSVVLFGLPARQIVGYARENDFDLIAMSTHGRSGIGQWVFGSVTDKVIHAGDIPVLVVRPTEALF